MRGETPDPRQFFYWEKQDEFWEDEYWLERAQYSNGEVFEVGPGGVKPYLSHYSFDGERMLFAVPQFSETVFWVCGACLGTLARTTAEGSEYIVASSV